LKVIDKRSDGT